MDVLITRLDACNVFEWKKAISLILQYSILENLVTFIMFVNISKSLYKKFLKLFSFFRVPRGIGILKNLWFLCLYYLKDEVFMIFSLFCLLINMPNYLYTYILQRLLNHILTILYPPPPITSPQLVSLFCLRKKEIRR